MARRLVLCLDPGRLLKPPCPVLFPEWGEELLVLSPGMTLDEWSRCASSISVAGCDGASVEVWHLVMGTRWQRRAQDIDALLADQPPPLRGRLLSTVLAIAWADADGPDPNDAHVVIRGVFEGEPPPAATRLSQRYLLPVGIRVLLDREELLRAMSSPSRPLRSVTVRAEGSLLVGAEREWAERLAAAKGALTTQREMERTRACDQPLLDPGRFSGLHVAFGLEPATRLALPFFQRLGIDDKAVVAWFEAEAKRIERATVTHRSELDRQVKQAIRQLASARPAPVAGAAETRPCETIRDAFRQETSGVTLKNQRQVPKVDTEHELRQWAAGHRVAVLLAARRRATARVFWMSSSLAAVAVALVNCVGIGAPTAASWAWPDIIVPAGVSVAAMGALAIAVAAWHWSRARSAVRVAADAMSALTKRLQADAGTAVEEAKRNIQHMVTMRNLSLMNHACEEQSARIAQVDAHVDAVLELLESQDNVLSVREGPLAPVDTDQRPESSDACFWVADSSPTQIRMGADTWDATVPALHRLLRRYAGVSAIEIECQP